MGNSTATPLSSATYTILMIVVPVFVCLGPVIAFFVAKSIGGKVKNNMGGGAMGMGMQPGGPNQGMQMQQMGMQQGGMNQGGMGGGMGGGNNMTPRSNMGGNMMTPRSNNMGGGRM